MLEIPKSLDRFKEKIEKTLKPSNEIEFKVQATKPWESKLGGCPYLEKAEDYPFDSNGEPMMFLAQVNFEEMPPLPDFPTKGILQFYINYDYFGLDEPCKVIYIEEYQKDETLLVSENPYEKDYEENLPFYNSGKMNFSQVQMPINNNSEAYNKLFEGIDISEDENDELNEFCWSDGSRVGGYPLFIQNPVECYESGEKDILLLQLDCDDDTGLMFGDCGDCQFLISREDLLKKDFSNVVYDWQCC